MMIWSHVRRAALAAGLALNYYREKSDKNRSATLFCQKHRPPDGGIIREDKNGDLFL